jgi:hypothetical protein
VTEVSIERDALRKSLKDASVEIEQLRLERDQLSQQMRVHRRTPATRRPRRIAPSSPR